MEYLLDPRCALRLITLLITCLEHYLARQASCSLHIICCAGMDCHLVGASFILLGTCSIVTAVLPVERLLDTLAHP